MSLHTFETQNPPNIGRVFFGNAVPVAPDGNSYVIGDVIRYINVPIGTAAPGGSPVQWQCIVAGVGGVAQWITMGASQGITATAFSNSIGVVQNAVASSGTVLRFTIPYLAVPAGASPQSVSLFTPPAKSIIGTVLTKHSVAFSGGGLTDLTVSVGIAGTVTKYTNPFDVFQAVAGNTFELSVSNSIDSWTAPGSVIANFVSIGANPNAATAGVVDIYLWVNTASL